jgi:hypothetical protein
LSSPRRARFSTRSASTNATCAANNACAAGYSIVATIPLAVAGLLPGDRSRSDGAPEHLRRLEQLAG